MTAGNSAARPVRAQPGASLMGVKWRAFTNTVRRGPKGAYVFVGLLAALLVWGEVEGTLRALRFLEQFGSIGTAVFRRVLEIGLIVLSAGVTFSAVTTAISTLYLSDDLNFLLAQPVPARRVFTLKVLETFLVTALVPTLLIVPVLLTVCAYFAAPAWAYALCVVVAALAFALPVGVGAGVAVFLMRVAPLGRVREVATALGVLISAGLVYVIRAARPEVLLQQAANPEEFDRLLAQLGTPGNPLLPPAWAAAAVWNAAHGTLAVALLPLVVACAAVLVLATWLATVAYHEGWARGLESSRVRLDPTPRGPSRSERLMARLGPGGAAAFKDARLLLRDPTQWSQLMVLVALAGVYVVSVRTFPLQVAQFQSIVGYIQLAFQGFVITGVGLRLAFPAVSTEARGYWLLRTAPISARDVVISKYLGALPPILLLAVALGWLSARALGLPELIVLASVLVAVSNALVITSLGVGVGAAMPRFRADNPAEIGLTPGGLLYMLLGLAYSVLLLALLARPVFMSIYLPDQYPGYTALLSPEGLLGLVALLAVTVALTLAPLWYGARQLDSFEDGQN